MYTKTIVPASTSFSKRIGELSQVKYIAQWLTVAKPARHYIFCHSMPTVSFYEFMSSCDLFVPMQNADCDFFYHEL